MKYTKDQRDFMMANTNNIIGAGIVFFIYEFAGDLAREFVKTGLIWFIYFTTASAISIFIYNSIRKELNLFMDLGAFYFFRNK